MKTLFDFILTHYLTEKRTLFRGNELSKYIREKPYEVINQKAYIDNRIYLIGGSPGKGNWAEIPGLPYLIEK